jgi:hypothetical protein
MRKHKAKGIEGRSGNGECGKLKDLIYEAASFKKLTACCDSADPKFLQGLSPMAPMGRRPQFNISIYEPPEFVYY